MKHKEFENGWRRSRGNGLRKYSSGLSEESNPNPFKYYGI